MVEDAVVVDVLDVDVLVDVGVVVDVNVLVDEVLVDVDVLVVSGATEVVIFEASGRASVGGAAFSGWGTFGIVGKWSWSRGPTIIGRLVPPFAR